MRKKILIQIGHPAQFHFYKNAVRLWIENNHKVILLIRKKDVLEDLAQKEGLPYVNIEKNNIDKTTKWGIVKFLFNRFYHFLKQLILFKPNIVISPDPILARLCKFFRINFIAVSEDDYSVIKKLADWLFPFSTHILAPTVCDFSKWQDKKIEYQGYMKLAYLHPNWFKGQKEITQKYIQSDRYVLIRLVSLVAHHDEGVNGINNQILEKIIGLFEANNYQVYISSEKKINNAYEKYRLNAPVNCIHHIMNEASCIVCDSQSMAVESAMLGVPSVRFNDFAGKISVLEELEHKYKLTFGIKTDNPNKLYQTIENLLSMENVKEEFQARRQKMLADKIDVTAFLVWFVENYPNSAKVIKENPDYQYNFK